MKVSIQLDTLGNGDPPTYTSTDWVKGNILVVLQRADAVSKITLSLQGKLVSSVQSANTNPLSLDVNFHAVDSHKVLKSTQTIFPQHNVPIPSKGFSLSKGTTSIPFKVRFPVLSNCAAVPHEWIKHVKTTLPPSFSFTSQSNDGSAAVEYSLKIEVVRPQRFKSDIIERQVISFLPLDPALPPPMLEPTRSKTTKNLKYQVLGSPNATSSTGMQVLDTRQVTLEATLPAPAILRSGGGLQLGATLSALPGQDGTPLLYLRSFTLRLMTEVTIDVGPNLKSWQTFKEFYSDMNIEQEIKDDKQDIIPNNLTEDARLPEDITPSFTTCTFKQEHFIVVVAGLSYGLNGHIMNIKTSINVEIHSGITKQPTRDGLLTPEEEITEDELTFIPWRIGSDRHLGILGRRDSRSDNAPPPPYA